MTTLVEVLAEHLVNPAFKAEYDRLGPDYALASAIIRYIANHGGDCATLAKQAKLSKRLVERMRGATANPTLKQIKRLARALGVSVAEMLGERQ